LTADADVVRVAFVCLGNICRSPMAVAVASALVEEAGLGERVVLESFGTADYHVGKGADSRTSAALRRRGWSADDHRARCISAGDLARADLVLAADRSNVEFLRRLARDPGDRSKIRLLRSFDPLAPPRAQEVADPWFGEDADFDSALEQIEAACRGLVEHLAKQAR
jgi:protein-tyrosine phosphatase